MSGVFQSIQRKRGEEKPDKKKKLMLSGQVLGNFNCFLCAIVSQMNSAGNNNRFMITFVLKVR